MTEEGLPEGEARRTLSGSIMAFFARRPHAIPSLIAAAMLLVAMGKWPYDYYTLMRWVVCAAGVLSAVLAYRAGKHWAIAPFAVVAALFNPLAPIHLRRETWAVLDLLAGVVLLCMAAAPLKKAPDGQRGTEARRTENP